jgi:hypothetical protein
VLPHRHKDPFGIQVQLIHQKWVGMAGAKAIARQDFIREVIQVEGDDQIGTRLDGGSQNMAVIRVWSFQGWNQGLITIDQRITHVSIHQRAGALQLCSGEIRPVPKHRRRPLLVNLVTPAGPIEIRERQAHQQIAERS